MYLSSFRLGDHPEQLTQLTGPTARVAVIANATDAATPAERDEAVQRELDALTGLGLRAAEVDLRDYFGRPEALADQLAGVQAVWVRGGNTFVLRCALSCSGADRLLTAALREDGLVYAGYSAGPCVLAPTLRGLEAVDDPGDVARVYRADVRWDGLGILDYAIVPHCQSPGHPETTACDLLAARYQRTGVPHRTLRDGQAMVISGSTVTLR